MHQPPLQKAKIIRIEKCGPDTMRIWFELYEIKTFEFKPGQHVALELPIHHEPEKRLRNFSIASWPDGSNIFELLVISTPGGDGTNFLFNDATVGDELFVSEALGSFILPTQLDQDIFLICTGTGLAPFRSMINHLHHQAISFSKIYLICGSRYKNHLYYHEELKILQETTPGFQYIPTLSREHWDGHRGYVHPIYELLCKAKQPAQFFLCGWKNMVREAKKKIMEMGYDKKQIHY